METATIDNETLIKDIRAIFAEVTRYPLDILDGDAHLEEDLGIDSVKLAEIFAVIREKYNLPEDLIIPPEDLQSINKIAAAMAKNIPSDTNHPNLSKPQVEELPKQGSDDSVNLATTSSPAAASSMDKGSMVKELQQIFADVTRYPVDILSEDALFEEELGIDSVKLAEIFAVVRDRYHLPEDLVIPPEQLQSINTVADAVLPYVSTPETGGDAASPSTSNISSASYSDANHTQSTVNQSESVLEKSHLPLKDQVIFVSGSGRGIGKALVKEFASRGAKVIVNSFHSRELGEQTADEIKQSGGTAIHIWGSVANPDHVQNIFTTIESEFGVIDAMVANSSNGMLAKLEDLTVEHWEKAYRTNVIGLHQCALAAVKLMKKKGKGKILTLSSPAAYGYVDYFACMGSVKMAVESLTRSMASEFAPYNIQVNCISPGPVYGDLLGKWPESERLVRQWEERTPYKRLCKAEDVADFAAYLLQDSTELFNGGVLVMDGGISSVGF